MTTNDAISIYCGECDSRVSAPPYGETSNPTRDLKRLQQRVLRGESVRDHFDRHGPAEVMSCADLYEAAGITMLGTDPTALVRRHKGNLPVCHYEVHLLGGFEVPAHFTAARTSLLLPHWHRGCRTMQYAMEWMSEDTEPPTGVFTAPRTHVRCDLCDFEDHGLTDRHSAVTAWHHAATEHPVGAAAVSFVGCTRCEQSETVIHDLESPVGTPRWCNCENAVYWGRRLL